MVSVEAVEGQPIYITIDGVVVGVLTPKPQVHMYGSDNVGYYMPAWCARSVDDGDWNTRTTRSAISAGDNVHADDLYKINDNDNRF